MTSSKKHQSSPRSSMMAKWNQALFKKFKSLAVPSQKSKDLFRFLEQHARKLKWPLLVGSLSSCASPTYTTQQLIQKEQHLTGVEIDSLGQQVDAFIDQFTKAFSNYSAQSFKEHIPKLYSKDAFLNDRIHTIEGQDKILQYFLNSLDKAYHVRFEIKDSSRSRHDIYVRWIMSIQVDKDDTPFKFTGMTQIRLNSESQIVLHQDYWDYSELLGNFTGIGSLIHFLKSKS